MKVNRSSSPAHPQNLLERCSHLAARRASPAPPLMAHWAALLVAVLSADATPPLYRITARDHYSAGVQHGRLARERIRGWLRSDEMVALRNFTARAGAGRDALEAMKRDNRAAYPELAAELRGIAAGARVPEDAVWTATLISELESLQPDARPRAGHCTDVYAVGEGGGGPARPQRGLAGVVAVLVFVASTAAARSRAPLVCPGAPVGWAPTWNVSMYLTQNPPSKVARAGGPAAFVQRGDLRRVGVAARLRRGRARAGGGNWARPRRSTWSTCASAAWARRGAWTRRARTRRDGARGQLSHMNMLGARGRRRGRPRGHCAARRVTRCRRRGPPTTSARYCRRRRSVPIYRDMTLTTLVLDGLTGKMRAGGTSAMGEPVFEWDLLNFWRDDHHGPPRVRTVRHARPTGTHHPLISGPGVPDQSSHAHLVLVIGP